MKFDLHCHTRAGSIDAIVPVETYISLLQQAGFDGMLITDHDSYKGYRYWQTHRQQMPEDFVVLMGVEYDTKDAGHFLVIMPDGVCLRVLQIRGMSLQLLTQIVHHFGGILGPAHPFGARSNSAMFHSALRKNPDLVYTFDFLEGFNTCESPQANLAAQQLAQRCQLPCIGGSDSHKAEYIGTAYTYFDQDIQCNNDLIRCIRDGDIAAFGGKERTMLRKHRKRHSLAATWGFHAYNRTLGVIFAPYRNLRLRRLDKPQPFRETGHHRSADM